VIILNAAVVFGKFEFSGTGAVFDNLQWYRLSDERYNCQNG
jgi:hypothetical protein